MRCHYPLSEGFPLTAPLPSLSCSLSSQPGQHVIRPDTEIEGPICGLLPVSGK